MPNAGRDEATVIQTRTLLVGGNDVFLDGVVECLARDDRFEIVGRAHSGSKALECLDELRAQLVVMDVTLPDTSGFEIARRIKARAEAPLVVLLSFHESQAARLEAWAAGADGFVAKSEILECLTSLAGELLGRRKDSVREDRSAIPFKRVPPADLTK